MKVRAKGKLRPKSPRIAGVSEIDWAVIGIDLSLATISVGCIAHLKTGWIRVGTFSKRWDRTDDYYERLKFVTSPYLNVFYPMWEQMRIQPSTNKVEICYEEPVPLSAIQGNNRLKGAGNSMKQQIQISGSLAGGLLRDGYTSVIEIPANKWRQMVAADLGITIYHAKWNDRELVPGFHFHCGDKNVGKYRAQQWVERFHPKWDGHWTDIIQHAKLGTIPRPITSKAQGIQSDDRYEALAMAEWLRRDLKS